MAGRSLIAIAVSLAMVTVVLGVVETASSEIIASGHCLGGYGDDRANAIEIDSSGNVYLAGEYVDVTDQITKGFIAKFAADGSLAWNLGLQYQSYHTSVTDIALDADGNAYVLFYAPASILAKVTSSGTVSFAKELTGLWSAYRVAYNPVNGGAIVVGDKLDYGQGIVASFSSTGVELWSSNFASSDFASPWGVTVDSSGNIYAVMDRSGDNVGVIEFSSTGNITRQVILSTEFAPEYSWDIAVDSAGYVYVLGLETYGMHTLVAKMTSALEPIWTEYLVSDTSWQECLRLAISSDGSIFAVGQGTAPTANYSGAISFHLASDGTLLESSIYDGGGMSMLYFNDAAVSSTGAIVFAGLCYGSPVLIPTPIPDEAAVPPTGAWISDSTAWSACSMGAVSATLDAFVPDAVVDNYDTSYGLQAWFGRVGVPELSASIDYRVSGKDSASFQFRGSVSGGQKPYTFSWSLGDGAPGTGKRVAHTYSGPGQYAVMLTVYDSQGKFGYASAVVSVFGPPVINYVSTSYPVYVNTITWFSANAYDPDGGAIASYAWDFGDGTSTVLVDPWADHIYMTAGTCLVQLTVTDDEGDTAYSQTMVDVLAYPNIPPVAMFSFYPTPMVGSPVTFDASSSYDPDGYIVQFVWTFGDGYSANGSAVTHTYAAAGTYFASLAVTDNLGATAYAMMNVTVYQQGAAKNWTFLVYLDADNNLEEVGSVDFMEMSAVGSDANINIVVEMDRTPYYDSYYGDWTTTKRFYVNQWMTPDGYNALQDLGEMNMGDPQTLLDFIVWGVSAYPADNYALILWDHGGGWDGAVCWDDTNYDSLTLDEVESALAQANNVTGVRVNLLGFDACLMGMVEVAYEVVEYVDVIAFSEETVPWDGLPYNTILWDLKAYPMMSAVELGNVIVSRYMEFYTNESMGDPYVTMSSMDISASAPLYLAIEQFSNELRTAIPTEQAQIIGWMYNTEYFAYVDYIDLYHFAQIVSENTSIESLRNAALAVMSAVDATLTSEGHGFMHPNAHGLSIYFPQVNSSYLEYYASMLDFTAAFSWDEFLIEELAAKDDQYEPDNDYTQATPIVHSETQIHSIGNGGLDVDWLVFEVAEPSLEIRVNTSGLPGVYTDTELMLYDVYGVPYYPIATDDNSGQYGCSMIQMFLSQGTYYVKVTSYGMGFEIPWYGVSAYIGDIPNIPPYAWIDYWPYDPGVGTQIQFIAYMYDQDGYIADIVWDFGDGTSAVGGQNYTLHAYDAPGDYTVVLTVTDDDGASTTASANVHVVMNLVPVAAMDYYPSLPNPYETVYFDGGGSNDPDGYIQYYYWDFGDGYTVFSYSSYTNHYYYQGGLYLVTLTVTDNRGATNSTSAWIHVNMPPVAVIVPSVETGKVGAAVTFDGSGSYDPEGSPITVYSWYFSDGGNETGPIVTHTFYDVGYYDVYLQVRETNGSWGYSSLTFAVTTAVPPAAIIAYSPSSPLVGQEVLFDGRSSVDPDGSIVTYIWQLGDGVVATGDQVVHAYWAPGTYEIQLTVIDEDKLLDKSVTKITVVSKPAAGFEYSPAAPVAGQETTFYAVGSYDPTGITLYVWSFGDGTYAQGWQASHTFAAIGDYTVALTVTNAMGIQTTISKTVSVAAAPLAPAESNVSDMVWDEPSEPSIELLVLVLCAISMAVGCLVGDVAVCLVQRRKGT